MEIEIFTLCDYAQNMNGKLTIVGTFDTLGTINFPFMQPHCSIAVRLRFSNKEVGQHRGYITFKHKEGDFMGKIEFGFDVRSHPNGYSKTNLVLNIGNLLIKDSGKYTIELFINDEWKTGLTFFVNQVNKAA